MSKVGKYYQFQATIDSKIIGRSELPISVVIKDKTYSEQSRKYTLDINKYFEEFPNFYKHFPKELSGKMYQRKKSPIDIMNAMPYYPTLKFVVSEKVKNIIEALSISKSEYHLENFKIEGYDGKFFFLFIPLLKSKEYLDFSKSIFVENMEENEIIFDNYEQYMESFCRARTLYVKKELENRDIISLQAGGPFYSERIIKAFQKENVVGYEIISGGDFKIDLHFI